MQSPAPIHLPVIPLTPSVAIYTPPRFLSGPHLNLLCSCQTSCHLTYAWKRELLSAPPSKAIQVPPVLWSTPTTKRSKLLLLLQLLLFLITCKVVVPRSPNHTSRPPGVRHCTNTKKKIASSLQSLPSKRVCLSIHDHLLNKAFSSVPNTWNEILAPLKPMGIMPLISIGPKLHPWCQWEWIRGRAVFF